MANLRTASWLAFTLPAALLGGALISQYGFGLFPCEMCMWQRWPHMAAIAVALLAIMLRNEASQRLLVVLAALGILISGLIGGFHAGVEYGWWEGFTTCSTTTVTDLDSIMNAPLVRCDVAPWTLLGISLAGFNFLISCGGAILVLILMRRKES